MAVALVVLLGTGQLLADGMILPRERFSEEIIFNPRTRPDTSFTVPLSVLYHRVEVAINDLAAETKIDQSFYNHLNRVIEGVYLFPLPVGASISNFAMDVEGTMTKGELLDRDKARKIYEDIVRTMRDPGLLEYMGTGLFKASIFPIEALKEKPIKLTYQEALKMEGNLVRYAYPLNTERYSQDPIREVAIKVSIKAKAPIASVYSPSHQISVSRKSDHEVVVGFEAEKVKPDKDFVIYYSLSTKEVALSTLSHRPKETEDGYFMMLLAPRPKQMAETKGNKDVVFVIDTSGSMMGDRMTQTKAALRYCVQALRSGDRFQLVPFATEANPHTPGLIEHDPAKVKDALEFIERLEAVGGTNISEGLETGLQSLGKVTDAGRTGFIVFMTDGKPTAGVTEPAEIVKLVKAKNQRGVRIFAFGVGDGIDTKLCDQVAEENGGASDYVGDKEDIEIKVSNLFSKLTHPVMTDVKVEFNQGQVSQLYPQRLSDLFLGSNLVVLGRYAKPADTMVTLRGKVDGQELKLEYETSFPEREPGNPFVARIWATRKIGFLLDQIRMHGENDELKSEVVMLAKRFGILTPYTSFLVVEDKAVPQPLRRAMAPEGRADDEAFLQSAGAPFDSMARESSGANAVDAAMELGAMKSAQAPMAPGAAGGGGFARPRAGGSGRRQSAVTVPVTREMADRTFYHLDEIWTDSLIKDEPVFIKVKAYSPAYFEILRVKPDLVAYVPIGDRLRVLIDGKVVEISPDAGVEDASAVKW